MPDTNTQSNEGREVRSAGAALFTLGGIGAAFGVASCCGLPFLLAGLGIGTAWLTGIALLAAPHRSMLLLSGAFCLAAGAALLWWRRPTARCAARGVFSSPVVRGLVWAGLFAGAALLAIGYRYA